MRTTIVQKISSLLLLPVLLLCVFSCEKDAANEFLMEDVASVDAIDLRCNCQTTATLNAGQHHPVGTVRVRRDYGSPYIEVMYRLDYPWRGYELHLAVADDLEGIPQTKKGNPIPGQFSYKYGYWGCQKTIRVPVDPMWDEYCDPLVIAAHAVVKKCDREETAWAGTGEFPGKNWATYFTFNCCEPI